MIILLIMTKSFFEVLLFASVAINAALLIFFSGVYRKMMNEVDQATFKNLTEMLVRYSSRSPFMIIALNLPLVIAIPYYYLSGFGNWWITASLVLWLAAGSVSKILKLPVYKTIATLKNEDVAGLNEMRRKLNTGNLLQASLYIVAVIVMAVGLYK
jgi:hypothetical protein